MTMASRRLSTLLPARGHTLSAALTSLFLLGLSLPAHSDYDFNSPAAVVVPATPHTRSEEYAERARAEREAWEHERAEEQRQADDHDLMMDQQAREREEEAQKRRDAAAAGTGYADNSISVNNPSSYKLSPQSLPDQHEARSLRGILSNYSGGILLVLFILAMVYWIMQDRNTVTLTSQPAPRQMRADGNAPVVATPPVITPPRPVPSSNAAQPIDFHPVLTKAQRTPDHPHGDAINALAEQTLAAFRAGTTDSPLVYRSQLVKVGLDYSAASLSRLDQFVQQLRAQTQPEFSQYSAQQDYRNLLILLGFYIGTTIARASGQAITWYDHAGAVAQLKNPQLPDSIQTAYSCMIGPRYHLLPIDLLCNMLFADTPTESCSAKLAFYQAQAADERPSDAN